MKEGVREEKVEGRSEGLRRWREGEMFDLQLLGIRLCSFNCCCTSSLGRRLLLSEVSEKKRYEKGRREKDKEQEEKRGRREKERVE